MKTILSKQNRYDVNNNLQHNIDFPEPFIPTKSCIKGRSLMIVFFIVHPLFSLRFASCSIDWRSVISDIIWSWACPSPAVILSHTTARSLWRTVQVDPYIFLYYQPLIRRITVETCSVCLYLLFSTLYVFSFVLFFSTGSGTLVKILSSSSYSIKENGSCRTCHSCWTCRSPSLKRKKR